MKIKHHFKYLKIKNLDEKTIYTVQINKDELRIKYTNITIWLVI